MWPMFRLLQHILPKKKPSKLLLLQFLRLPLFHVLQLVLHTVGYTVRGVESKCETIVDVLTYTLCTLHALSWSS